MQKPDDPRGFHVEHFPHSVTHLVCRRTIAKNKPTRLPNRDALLRLFNQTPECFFTFFARRNILNIAFDERKLPGASLMACGFSSVQIMLPSRRRT